MTIEQKRRFSLSAKVIIRNVRGLCLVLKRSQASANNAGRWDFPGGKIDRGESFEEGLLREVEEETGLEILLHRVVGFAESRLPPEPGRPDRSVAYLILEGRLESGTPCVSEEHDDAIWVEPERLNKLDLCPQFRQFAEDLANRDAT